MVNYAAVFLTGVLLTRYLTKVEYGTFSQILLLATTLSLIFRAWLAKSIYYFVPTSEHKKEIVVQTTLTLLGLGLLAAVVIWVLRCQIAQWFGNQQLSSLIMFVSLYVLMLTLYGLVEPFFISLDRAHLLSVTNIVFSFVYLFAISYGLSRDITLRQLMMIIILLYLGLNLYLLINILGLPGRLSWIINRQVLSGQLRYAAPLFLSSTIIVLGQQADKFIIATFYPTTDFAVYFRGAIELPMIVIITYTISNMLLPKWVQLFRDDRKKDFLRVWHQAVKKTALLMFPLFAIFLFLSQRFITFLYTERYSGSVPIFRIYLLVLLIQVTAYDCVLQATGRTKGIFYASLLNVASNITVSLLLIRLVGPVGAAIGLICGQGIAALYYLLQIRGIFQLSLGKVFPWLHLLQVFVLAMGLGAAVYSIHFTGWFSSSLSFMSVYSLLFVLLYGLSVFMLKFLRLRDLEFFKLSIFQGRQRVGR
jgi:O-antigen/teichoic acid export membrane protein